MVRHSATGIASLILWACAGTHAEPLFSTPLPGADSGTLADVVAIDLNADTRPDLIGVRADALGVQLGQPGATFGPRTEYPVPDLGAGGRQVSLVVRDVNDDGAPDAIVHALGGAVETAVYVYLNDGAGAFEPPTTYAAGDILYFADQTPLVADFTGDGAPDILAQAPAPFATGVLINNADGTFSEPTAEAASGQIAADFNADDAADLALYADEIAIHFSQGDGSFGPRTEYRAHPAGPVIAADIDDDDDTDLISPEAYLVRVLRNDGAGNFQEEAYLHVAGYEAHVGDVNLDDRNDIVLTSIGGPASMLADAQHDRFRAPRVYEGEAADIAVGDANSDAHPDLLLLTGEPDATILVRYSDATGALGPPLPLDFGPAGSEARRVRAVCVADLDGGGVEDVIGVTLVAGTNTAELAVLFNGAESGAVVAATIEDPCPDEGDCSDWIPPFEIRCADLDADGDTDLTLIDSARLLVYLNDGAGALTLASTLDIAQEPALTHIITDANADGTPDVVARTNLGVRVLFGAGDGTFDGPSVPIANLASTRDLSAGDLTGDDAPELILADSSRVLVLGNPGDGLFTGVTQEIPLGTPLGAIATGVANADSDADLDVWLSGGGVEPFGFALSLLENDGTGALTARVVSSAGAGARLLTADLNADDRDDVITGLGNNFDNITVFLADPNGTTPVVEADLSQDRVREALLADADNDTIPDVIGIRGSPDENAETVVLPGVGDGTFASPSRTYPAFWRRPSAALNLNADARIDILSDGPQLLLHDPAFGDFGTFNANLGHAIALAFGDVNADAIDDVIAAREGEGGAVEVLLGDATGRFQPTQTLLTDAYVLWLDLAEMTGDGRPDIVYADLQNDGRVGILRNRGDAGFTPGISAPVTLPGRIVHADLDRDGWNDLIVTSLDDDAGVTIMLNRSGRSFDVAPLGPPLENANPFVAHGDIDADGDIDLARHRDNQVFPYLNRGDGTFDPAPPIDLCGSARAFLLADLDADLRADLITSERCDEEPRRRITVRRAQPGGFAPPHVLATELLAETIKAADVTGDGWPDVLALGDGPLPLVQSLCVVPSLGAGAFDEAQWSVASGTDAESHLDLADIDADGSLDALAWSWWLTRPWTMTVSINRAPPPPPRCDADVNGDAVVDVADFSTLCANFAQPVPIGTGGDLDHDADVDVFDFAILAAEFGCTSRRR